MRTATNDPMGGVSKSAKSKASETRGIKNRMDELGLGLGAGAWMNVAAGWFGNWSVPSGTARPEDAEGNKHETSREAPCADLSA